MLSNTNVTHRIKQVLLCASISHIQSLFYGRRNLKANIVKTKLKLCISISTFKKFIILKWNSNIWNILGPAYDLTVCEVRNTSLVLLWKAPVYEGKSPITGYLVDYKEVDKEDWITANEKPTAQRYFKVTFTL